jgi:hypothetical protein
MAGESGRALYCYAAAPKLRRVVASDALDIQGDTTTTDNSSTLKKTEVS